MNLCLEICKAMVDSVPARIEEWMVGWYHTPNPRGQGILSKVSDSQLNTELNCAHARKRVEVKCTWEKRCFLNKQGEYL